MKLAILEWICGGGLFDMPEAQIPNSLRSEGWTMLDCLATQFANAGLEVATILDERLVDQDCRDKLSAQGLDFNLLVQPFENRAKVTSRQVTLKAWNQLALNSDLTLVIAPELDGILQDCVAELSRHGVKLLNCREPFLTAACDKWITAQKLAAYSVAHPSTWLVSDFPLQSIDLAQRWCLKPRFGAGCEGLMVASARDVPKIVEQHLSSTDQWIIQPWIEGRAFSCSTITDRHGVDHWLPLVTQDLKVWQEPWKDAFEVWRLSYQGGRIVLEPSQQRPIDLLDSALCALRKPLVENFSNLDLTNVETLGWIGVDLLRDLNGNWIVIEVNPRMTTSVLGLSGASNSNLGQLMIEGFFGTLTRNAGGSLVEINHSL